jgi:hypothetical protein
VLWKRAVPSVELVGKIGQFLQRQVVGRLRWVDFFENLGEDA